MKPSKLVDLVAENTPAIWILWEAKNLELTYQIPQESNGPNIRTTGDCCNHDLEDVIENLRESVANIIGLYQGVAETDIKEKTERLNVLGALDIQLEFGPESGARQFKLVILNEIRIVNI